jgi:RNA polymerase sigma-70 factor (ECF subfamily)
VRRTDEISCTRADSEPTPEQQLLEIEGARYLNDRVWQLPEKFRIPLLMRYMHQQSYKEIAAALSIPESTVIGRLAGALRILRRQMRGGEL